MLTMDLVVIHAMGLIGFVIEHVTELQGGSPGHSEQRPTYMEEWSVWLVLQTDCPPSLKGHYDVLCVCVCSASWVHLWLSAGGQRQLSKFQLPPTGQELSF